MWDFCTQITQSLSWLKSGLPSYEKFEVRFIYFYFLANDFDSRRQTRIPKLGVTLCFHGAVSGALIGTRCNLGVDRTAGQVHSLEPRRRSSNVLILEAHVFDFHW